MLNSRTPRIIAALAIAALITGTGDVRAANDLDRAFQIISAKTFVDLTHRFGPDTPVWSGFGQAKMSPAVDPKSREPYTIAKDGFRFDLLRDGRPIWHPYRSTGAFRRERSHHGCDSGEADDPAAGGARRHAFPHPRSQPRLLACRSQGLGAGAWSRAEGGVRGAAHRHVQGLGHESGAVQAQRLPGLVPRDHKIPGRAARRHGDRP